MFAVLTFVIAAAAEPANLLTNPSFDEGLAGWEVSGDIEIGSVEVEDRTAARMTVPDTAEVNWPGIRQRQDAEPDAIYDLTFDILARDTRDGYGAYAAVEFQDASGTRIAFGQTEPARAGAGWQSFRLRAVAPEGAAKLSVNLLLHGHGTALFDNVHLARTGTVAVEPVEVPVTLTVTGEVVCPSIIGFGAEDDAWFYSPANTQHGVGEEGFAVREGRIDWMKPDYVRMFFWLQDWNPSGDHKTFTFDSPNMQSHYRALDQYQRLGTRVNLTNVEWGMPTFYRPAEEAAPALAALVEHLVKERGYTCIRDWTLTNEPNGGFMRDYDDFDLFVDLHRRVREEFDRRGLDLNIVGADDAISIDWFRRCVAEPDYANLADLFSTHLYLPFSNEPLVPFMQKDRLDAMAENGVKKPLIVGEFGFQDGRASHLVNPIMEEYRYALWAAEFAIDGLNQGIAGFNIWCLHEVYYPSQGFMNYALWNYKDRGWSVRPVYHAWAMFTRLTEAGQQALRCESSAAHAVKAAVVGETLFWVNGSDQELSVRIEGLPVSEVRVMTEDTLHGDRECGTVVAVEAGAFTAPPKSFGYAQ